MIVEGGAGQGDEVQRHAVVGDETVLDVLSQVEQSDQLKNKRIWIARPQPGSSGVDAILPVEWTSASDPFATCNNYQILPGDRIFITQLTWWQQLLEKAAALHYAQSTSPKNSFPFKPAKFHSY